MKIIATCYIFLISTLVFSQETENSNIKIIQDNRISELVSTHIELNKVKPGIIGWRVQIFFDSGNNSKTNANTLLEEFRIKYPGLKAYIVFQEPYYKVRVGDYRNRMEAEKIQKLILVDFPNAFIVKDEINFPDL